MYFSISRCSLAANFFLQQCVTAKRPTKMTATNANTPIAKPILESWEWSQPGKLMSFLSPDGVASAPVVVKPTSGMSLLPPANVELTLPSPDCVEMISGVGWTTWPETSTAGDSTDGGRLAAAGVGLTIRLAINVDKTGRGPGVLTQVLSLEGSPSPDTVELISIVG